MKKTLVIVSALALGTTLVLAQSPGPGGQGQGGQGQGGRGQGFGRQQGMRGGGGGIRIVTRPDVQKELNLTDQQKTAIQEKLPAMGRGGRNGGGQPGGAPGGGGAAGAPPGTAGGGGAGANGGLPPQGGQGGRGGFGNNAEAQAKLDADIKAILSETQYKRLHELMLQFDGPGALMRADVAKQFDLTEEQRTKIQGIQQTQMQNMRERMQGGGGGGDRQAMMQEMQKMREETNKQILAVLSAEQLKKWNDAQGKAFKFEGRG